jgi:hypothetical protein
VSAGTEALAGVHQRLPDLEKGSPDPFLDPADQQTFDGTAARLAAPQQPRREDARVVHDKDVAVPQQTGKITDELMLHASAVAVEAEQACSRAIGGRLLRNQFGGEIEIEVADVHRSRY